MFDIKLCTISLLSILFTLLPAPTSTLQEQSIERLKSFKLSLTSVVGPESLAFDNSGKGPYTGVSDGRILKWKGEGHGWAEFGIPPGHRKKECDNTNNSLVESICGRPLGLQFNKATGDLYIADAYNGLLMVGPKGGVATHLANGADGQPFNFTNGLDIDQENGVVYFTDGSIHFQRSNYLWIVISGDASGRLMRYDPRSKQVTVLIKGIAYPNGVAISKDSTFLLVTETGTCRVMRFWLRGRRAGTYEVFAELPGYPDNIKRNVEGEFWVALSQEKINSNCVFGGQLKVHQESGSPEEHPIAMKFSENGDALEVLNGGILTSISEVEERNGTLWVGSVIMPYVGVYQL